MFVSLQSVSKNYNSKNAVSECSVSLHRGEIVALLGPNGSGKTTLLKLICGLLLPDQGNVSIGGKGARAMRSIVSFSGDGEDLYTWMTSDDVRKFMVGLFADFDVSKFDELVSFLEVPRQSFSRMSKGEKRRLKLAAALARRASVYLLDEPLSGIDIIARERILKGIERSWDTKSTLVLSTHEFEGAEGLFHRVLMMKQGQLVQDLSAAAIKASGQTIVENYKQVFL